MLNRRSRTSALSLSAFGETVTLQKANRRSDSADTTESRAETIPVTAISKKRQRSNVPHGRTSPSSVDVEVETGFSINYNENASLCVGIRTRLLRTRLFDLLTVIQKLFNDDNDLSLL